MFAATLYSFPQLEEGLWDFKTVAQARMNLSKGGVRLFLYGLERAEPKTFPQR